METELLHVVRNITLVKMMQMSTKIVTNISTTVTYYSVPKPDVMYPYLITMLNAFRKHRQYYSEHWS